jgi:hypothetical protein
MRVVAGCLFVAAASVVLAPSSQELHNRYGEPFVERFMARPGISVAVEYGSDQRACQVLIEPPQPLFHTEEHAPPMSSEAVTEILEEIVPMQTRGKLIGITDTSFGLEMEIFDYENVSITRSNVRCCLSEPNRQENRATVVFKRDICPNRRIGVNATPFSESVPKSWANSR